MHWWIWLIIGIIAFFLLIYGITYLVIRIIISVVSDGGRLKIKIIRFNK